MLKYYDIDQVTGYLAARDVLAYSETKKIECLPTKLEKISFFDSLFKTNPERCQSFAKALKAFSANVHRESFIACQFVEQSSLVEKKKRSSTNKCERVPPESVKTHTHMDNVKPTITPNSALKESSENASQSDLTSINSSEKSLRAIVLDAEAAIGEPDSGNRIPYYVHSQGEDVQLSEFTSSQDSPEVSFQLS